jgi:hypothetical protein
VTSSKNRLARHALHNDETGTAPYTADPATDVAARAAAPGDEGRPASRCRAVPAGLVLMVEAMGSLFALV